MSASSVSQCKRAWPWPPGTSKPAGQVRGFKLASVSCLQVRLHTLLSAAAISMQVVLLSSCSQSCSCILGPCQRTTLQPCTVLPAVPTRSALAKPHRKRWADGVEFCPRHLVTILPSRILESLLASATKTASDLRRSVLDEFQYLPRYVQK